MTRDANAPTSLEPQGWREAPSADDDDREIRIKRLTVRCWRRGWREMDLILGGFVDAHARALDLDALAALETLIREDDATLYRWICRSTPAPEAHWPILERIRAHVAETEGGARRGEDAG